MLSTETDNNNVFLFFFQPSNNKNQTDTAAPGKKKWTILGVKLSRSARLFVVIRVVSVTFSRCKKKKKTERKTRKKQGKKEKKQKTLKKKNQEKNKEKKRQEKKNVPCSLYLPYLYPIVV